MSSTSKKHSLIVREPMRGKRITELPGIGEVYGERLSTRGYHSARDLLGEYLTRKGDEESFYGFMKDNCGANSKSARDCHAALKEWSSNFI